MTTVQDLAPQGVAHTHRRGCQIRRFVGYRGVFFHHRGEWVRPLHVWLYRGAWRVICWPCATSIQSGDDMYGAGWPTQTAAFDAAVGHCRSCLVTEPELQVVEVLA